MPKNRPITGPKRTQPIERASLMPTPVRVAGFPARKSATIKLTRHRTSGWVSRLGHAKLRSALTALYDPWTIGPQRHRRRVWRPSE